MRTNKPAGLGVGPGKAIQYKGAVGVF